MMSKKSPQLRFEGFTDDWEERKLGELVEQIIREVPKPNKPYYRMSVRSHAKGTFKQFVDNPENVAMDKLFVVKKDDLVVNITFAWEHAIAVVNEENDGLLVSHRFPTYRADGKSDIEFLHHVVSKENFRRKLEFISPGGAGRNRVLNKKDFLKLKIFVPKIEEQQKIGSFFKQLDNTIALHQRKLDLLKEQKKGFLQKMFPKTGEKVPELRFSGFTDDWEERKLSDVANHRGGTAIEKYFDKDGVYKVISIGSYGLNSQYVDQNIRAISNEITDGRVVNSGELTMVLNDKTANGTIIGRALLIEQDDEYVINQRTEIISPKETFDSNFAYTILNGPFREKVKRIVQGGTQIYVNYPAVSNLTLELPKIEEQQKIGTFFKQLDNTIALHQRKLDLLKEQKKGFLQKMFV